MVIDNGWKVCGPLVCSIRLWEDTDWLTPQGSASSVAVLYFLLKIILVPSTPFLIG